MNLLLDISKLSKMSLEIGQGTFGTVSYVDSSKKNIVKKCMIGNDEENDILDENFVEGVFLSTFKADFIPETKVVVVDGSIEFYQPYKGIDIGEWSENTSFEKRMEAFPRILCQMSRILMFFKKINVVHNDIKTENICIDSDLILSIIDFGHVSRVSKNSPRFYGTELFYEPTYISKNKKIEYECDMFSMGLVAIYVLNGGLTSWTDKYWAVYSNNQALFEGVFGNLSSRTPKIFIDIVKSMLTFESRISPIKLYSNQLFRDLRGMYPIDSQSVKEIPIPEKVPISDDDFRHSDDNEKIVLTWIIDVLYTQGMIHTVAYTTKLYMRLKHSSRSLWSKKNVQLKACSCVLMTSVLYRSCMSVEDIVHCSGDIFTIENVIKDFLLLISELDWKVYPTVRICTENVQGCEDVEKIKNILTVEEILKPEEYKFKTFNSFTTQ